MSELVILAFGTLSAVGVMALDRHQPRPVRLDPFVMGMVVGYMLAGAYSNRALSVLVGWVLALGFWISRALKYEKHERGWPIEAGCLVSGCQWKSGQHFTLEDAAQAMGDHQHEAHGQPPYVRPEAQP